MIPPKVRKYVVSQEDKWVESAQAFYEQRARALKARRWLPAQLEEEFVGECLLLEVVARQEQAQFGLAEGQLDRMRITTKALTSVRRALSDMPQKVRDKIRAGEMATPGDDPLRRHSGDESEQTNSDRLGMEDVQYIASLMDGICGMQWMIWLSNDPSKPKGSGYTLRNLAALMGVGRMTASRRIDKLAPWFETVWETVLAGEARKVADEVQHWQEEEKYYFDARDASSISGATADLWVIDRRRVQSFFRRLQLVAGDEELEKLVTTAAALGLLGEGGRYLLTHDLRCVGIAPGAVRDFFEDLGQLITCRRRGVSWEKLIGLQAMVIHYLNWLTRLESRDLQAPENRQIIKHLEVIEQRLAMAPLGLQLWGGAMMRRS